MLINFNNITGSKSPVFPSFDTNSPPAKFQTLTKGELLGALLSEKKERKKFILRKFLIFKEMGISYIFLKESVSYISGNGNHEKSSLYFRKRNFLIFQETETIKNFLYFRK